MQQIKYEEYVQTWQIYTYTPVLLFTSFFGVGRYIFGQCTYKSYLASLIVWANCLLERTINQQSIYQSCWSQVEENILTQVLKNQTFWELQVVSWLVWLAPGWSYWQIKAPELGSKVASNWHKGSVLPMFKIFVANLV